MKKRLLIIMGSMEFGGAERVISLISEDFASRGWDVTIAMILYNRVDYVLSENIRVLDLTGGDASRLRRLPGWLKSIRHLVKEYRPDCILSFAARVNVVAQLACLGLDVPIVVSERNDPYMDGRSRGVDVLTNLLYPRAKVVVFQTKRAAGYFCRLKLRNCAIIPNPITVHAQRRAVTPGRIVTAGRLAPQKNHRMLLEAFRQICDDFPETNLTIYGDGPLQEETANLIRQLKLEDRVQLPGGVREIHERISDAQAFVLSSDYEGLSNALLEAMMMGIPCISTNCAGSDEYIEDGVNGFLTPVGDTDAFARAMRRLLENPEQAEVMAQRGKETAACLEQSRILEHWYRMIAE